jgi:hypothetical protein
MTSFSIPVRALLCNVGDNEGALSNSSGDLRDDSSYVIRLVDSASDEPVLLARRLDRALEILVGGRHREGHDDERLAARGEACGHRDRVDGSFVPVL